MVKNSIIVKTYVVGTHWNCLCNSNVYLQHMLLKIRKKTINGKLHFPSIMSIVFTSFEHSKLQISILIPVTTANCLCLHDSNSRLSLTQLCITQYYHLSRPDGLVPVFSPIYYCNSTTFISTMVFSPIYYCNSSTFISTTAKSLKLITRYEKLVPLINFSVFYNA